MLRRVLLADILMCSISGIAMIAGAVGIETLIGIPALAARIIGSALIVFAAFVFSLWRSDAPDPAGVWSVIALNLGWVIASVALLFTDFIHHTVLAIAVVLVQAVVVMVVAELQHIALRKTTPVSALAR